MRFADVRQIVDRHDPIGLLEDGPPEGGSRSS
jgi:hypothetical protein